MARGAIPSSNSLSCTTDDQRLMHQTHNCWGLLKHSMAIVNSSCVWCVCNLVAIQLYQMTVLCMCNLVTTYIIHEFINSSSHMITADGLVMLPVDNWHSKNLLVPFQLVQLVIENIAVKPLKGLHGNTVN